MACFVIVTFRSMFWVLSSIGTFMLAMSTIATPKWLIGKKLSKTFIGPFDENRTEIYHETMGIYNRCLYTKGIGNRWEYSCLIYAITFNEIASAAWKACIILLAAAIILLGIASIFAVISFCKQIFRRKSLMNLAGILQAFAGILLVIVVVLYPLGWDNKRVKHLCHGRYGKAGKFQIGHCSLGIAYFCAIGSVAASFFCSLFSFMADKAVFSSEVQDEILEGKQLICVP